MQAGSYKHMHRAGLLKFCTQIGRQLRALTPQLAGDDRCSGFTEALLQQCVRALAKACKLRTPRVVNSERCKKRCVFEARSDAMFTLNRTLACLSRITWAIEWLEPPAHDRARSARKLIG